MLGALVDSLIPGGNPPIPSETGFALNDTGGYVLNDSGGKIIIKTATTSQNNLLSNEGED